MAARTLSKAAGTVPYRRSPSGIEFLLVHRPKYDDWSLPKGHLDPNESFEAAALRETEEEAGVHGTLRGYIGSLGYRVKGRAKVVRYWLVATEGEAFAANSEVDEVRWLSPKKAQRMVSYTRDRNVLARAIQMIERPHQSTLYLVRHANAGKRNPNSKKDHKRPLSSRGHRQAAAIAARLLKRPLTAIEASRYRRCHDTVAPLAQALDVRVQHPAALVEGAPPEDLLKHIRTLAHDVAVLCAHGDAIADLLGMLAAEGVRFGDELEWRKGSVWTLELNRGRIVGGRYQPPPRG